MIEAGFTEEMKRLLASIKGKTFKSYECYKPGGFDATDGNLRINLGRFSVDIKLDLHPLDGDPAGFDEITWFTCEQADPKSKFISLVLGEPRQYLVNEAVTGVELVHDRIEYAEGDIVIEMDTALVLRTKFHAFMFSRGIWFSDVIHIEVSAPNNQPKRLKSAESLWVKNDDRQVSATRSMIVL